MCLRLQCNLLLPKYKKPVLGIQGRTPGSQLPTVLNIVTHEDIIIDIDVLMFQLHPSDIQMFPISSPKSCISHALAGGRPLWKASMEAGRYVRGSPFLSKFVGRSVSRSVSHSFSHSVSHSVSQSVSQSVSWSGDSIDLIDSLRTKFLVVGERGER